MTVKQYKTIVKTHEALESARKLILELNSGCMVLKEGERVEQRIGKVIAAIDEAILEGSAGAHAPQIASEPPNTDPAPAKPSTLSDLEQAGDVARYIREKGYKMGAVAWDLFCDNFSSYVKFENPGLLG